MVQLAGFVYDSAGVALSTGITVNIYARNTVTPVVVSPTVNASGYWQATGVAEGRYDVEIVNGTTTRRIKYDDELQVQRVETAVLQVRNPANTFIYDVVPGAITANRTLNLPVITGTDTIAVLSLAQTFTANKTFNSTNLLVRNPADTFSYTLAGGAITADRTLNLPVITGTDTLGALGVAATWTAVQTFVAPVLGTPGSGTLTNCTGLPISTGVSGLGAGVATALATLSSANLAAAVTDETGSGALLFATSPTMSGTWAGAVTLSGSTLTFSGGTASTSTSTGTIVISGSGGLGVGGAGFIGGALTVLNGATLPATAGGVRLPNDTAIRWRNAADTANFGITLSVSNVLTLDAVVNITNATASTSTTTGALVVTGGLGIGGAAYIGGVVNMQGAVGIGFTGAPTGSGANIGAASTNNSIWSATQGAASTTLYIGNASINVTSDARVKSHIVPFDADALALIDQLEAVEYDQHEHRPFGNVEHYVGLTAQNVYKVAPWAVNTQGGADCPACLNARPCNKHLPWQVKHELLAGLFVKAIQQLRRAA